MYLIINSAIFSLLFTVSPPDLQLSITHFIYNFLFFYSLFSIISFTGGKYLNRVFIIIFSLIFIGTQIKFKFQRDYTYFWDINLLKDAVKVFNNFKGDIVDIKMLFFILILVIVLILADKIKLYYSNRPILIGVSAILIFNLIPNNKSYSLEETFSKKGKVLGFIKSYSLVKESYAEGTQSIEDKDKFKLPDILEKQPIIDKDNLDVVVIQSETFYDIMRLEEHGIDVKGDVTKNFRQYQKEGIYGKTYVPVLGGMTCNSEFELLTGMSARLFQKGSIIYTGYLKNQTDSLAWRLKENGYKTVAIHDYERDFWERDRVYPLLGFDEFISMESFINPKKYDHWIADSEIFNKTLEELDKEDGKNKFIFTVTVQNHAPFSYKASKDVVNVKGFPKEDTKSMTNYVSGLNISDIALKDFMEKVRKRNKPTIVVFYGDHQPSADHKYFNTMDFFKEEKNKYETDYFIWYNKGTQIQNQNIDTSLIGIGNKVKELLGITNSYDRYVLKEYSETNRDNYFNITYGRNNIYHFNSFSTFNKKQ